MDDHLDGVVDSLCRIISFIQKLGQLGKIRTASVWTENAPGDLVTYLCPFGRGSNRFEGIEYFVSMIVKIGKQLAECVTDPGCRLGLLRRISPGIAVMKIDHHPHPHVFRTQGHFSHFLLAAMSVDLVVRRIDPHPQTNAVDAMIF